MMYVIQKRGAQRTQGPKERMVVQNCLVIEVECSRCSKMSHEGSVWRSTNIDNMVKGLILAPILLSMVILDTPNTSNTSNPCNVSSTFFQQNHATNNCNQPLQLELSV